MTDETDDRVQTVRSVVFGTDLSDGAIVPSRYAALFARHYRAELIVTHAFTLMQPAAEVEAVTHVHSEQRKQLEERLAELVEILAPLAGRATSTLAEGSPMQLIRETAEQRGPSLVALGTHAGGPLEHHIIGSVAEEILRTVHAPVLTVGPLVPSPPTAELEIRRILYATDFSAAAAAAAPYAASLARALGSEIDLMHVVSQDALDRSPDRVREQEHAFLSALMQLAPEHATELGKSRTFVEVGEVPERILEHANERRVDLIILGAHHHSWLAMHIRTGPAFQVIQAAACPVLTVSRS